ncbi:hypothetical protein [Sphingomonas hankookensis]|uniref:hypothetical protein n=1 Tax=Sphingomonas hankookensis TaxID=563996 RepID=UPI003D303037
MSTAVDPVARHGALPLAGIELGGTKCVCTLAHGPGAIVAQETVPTEHPAITIPAIAAVLQRWWDAGASPRWASPASVRSTSTPLRLTGGISSPRPSPTGR